MSGNVTRMTDRNSVKTKKKDQKKRMAKEWKMKKIRKYVHDKENNLLYALAAVVILVFVGIALSGLSRCRK